MSSTAVLITQVWLLVCLLLYVYGIVINKHRVYKRNINIYIALFFLILISVTFYIGRTEINFYSWWYTGQYEPFQTIISQFKYGSKISIIKNVIGNAIMLTPLSFLLMLKDKKYNKIFKQLVIILPVTISIEVLQAFTHTGSFDIDDIILNYFGTIIFTFIITRFNIIDKIRSLFNTDYKLEGKIKYILFYLVFSILIIFLISLLI